MKFPWAEHYFIARVLLHLSDEEFWALSPKKLMSLFEVYNSAKQGYKSNYTANQNLQNAKYIKQLLGG